MKKIHRFLVPFRRHEQMAIIEDRDTIHQMRTVLKMKMGEEIAIQDGRGSEVRGKIASLTAAEVRMHVVSEITFPADEVRITLYAAIVKGEHFDLIAEKATELGISRLVPVIAARSIKKEIRHERVERIIREAVEQSEGGWTVELSDPMTLPQALKEVSSYSHAWILHPEAGIQASDLVSSEALLFGEGPHDVAIFIGPEGGWEEGEIRAAEQAGCESLGVGRRVLKAETAAIAACTIIRLLRVSP